MPSFLLGLVIGFFIGCFYMGWLDTQEPYDG